MARSMIFHHTLPISQTPTAGSSVHVVNLLKAFNCIGYDVELIAGYARERQEAIARVRNQARKGRKFDFVFAWSSTSPSLAEIGNFFHPFLDLGFFRWCNRQDIPVGLFYGDVYWRFGLFRQLVPWYKRSILIPLFWYDWWIYRKTVDELLIPSMRMQGALPTAWPEGRVSPLSPGCNIDPDLVPAISPDGSPLRIFYVGSIVPPLYDLSPLIEGIQAVSGVHLTISCPEQQWREYAGYYRELDASKVSVVHASGERLKEYYRHADLFGLVRAEHPYLAFAMPVKAIEAIGYGLPIITSAGTVVADFIVNEGVGWMVESAEDFRDLLRHLRSNRGEVIAKQNRAREIRAVHTWMVRAEGIAKVLVRKNER